MVIIIHNDTGTTYGSRAYLEYVARDRRMSSGAESYLTGNEPPRYPVPCTMEQAFRLTECDPEWFYMFTLWNRLSASKGLSSDTMQ